MRNAKGWALAATVAAAVTAGAVEPLVIEDAAALNEAAAERAIGEICAGRPALVIGGPLLSKRLVRWKDETVPIAEFERRMNGLEVTHEALGAKAGFREGQWWQAKGWETLAGGKLEVKDGALHLTTGGELRQWDTWYARVNPFAAGDDLLVVEARSDYDRAQMSVELGGTKGERWFATLEVGREWKRFIVDPSRYAGAVPFDPRTAKVDKIALGVSCQYTPRMAGRKSSVHVRLLGSVRNPVPGVFIGELPFGRFPAVEGVWPKYKTYEKDGRVCVVDRPTGEGFGRGNLWRLKRLANPAESILLERRPGRPERCLALFGYTRPEELAKPDVRRRMDWAKATLADGALLFEAGADRFAYLPGETATLGAGWRGEAKSVVITVTDAQGRTVVERRADDLAGKRSWSFAWAVPPTPAKYRVRTVLDGADEIAHEFAMIDTAAEPKDAFITVKGGDFMLRGRPWYPVCVNFWPLYSAGTERDDYWNKWLKDGYYSPNLVRKDLETLVRLGGNAVSIQPAWEGSERNMVDFFRHCRELGVKVNLFVPHADPFRFNETKLTNLLYQSRAAFDSTVFAYDTSWEPGNYIFRNPQRNAYDGAWRDWIAAQFGSVAAAEKAWGVTLEKRANGDPKSPPDEAFRGDGAKWNRVMASYRRFMDNLTSSRWNFTRRVMRKYAPNQLVSFRQGNTLPWDFALTGPVRHLDFVCPEGYSFANTDAHEDAIGWVTRYVDAYSGGKPIIWSEFGRSVWDEVRNRPEPETLPVVAEYARRFYRAGLAAGANGFSPWWWPGGYRVDERSDYGIMGPDSTPRPAARALAEYAAQVKRPRAKPTATAWMDFDRDADAGGYCKATFGVGGEAFGAARAKGGMLGVRIAGTAYTSADCPAVALGDVPLVGLMPPKFLDADFDVFEWKRTAGETLNVRIQVGNPGPAAWKAGDGVGGVRLVVRDERTGRELAVRPLAADVPRFGATEEFAFDVPLAGARRLSFRLEAKGRFAFGQKRVVEL